MKNIITKSLLLLIIPGMLFSKSITALSMAKLSPDLKALVAETSPENAQLTYMRFSRVRTEEGPFRETLYPVTIRATDMKAVKAAGIETNSDYPGFSTARVNYEQLLTLAELESVTSVFQGDIYYPATDIAVGESGADLVHDAYLNNIAYDGTDVIILVIDTGIDWSHHDFRDPDTPTSSRILYIWDQTLTAGVGEVTPQGRDATNFDGLNYGVEYTKADIEDEIDGSAANFVRTQDTQSHGTLVAGAAAGNGAALTNRKYKGMAPDADLVIVRAGVASFTDNNLINALTYAQKIASATGKPVVVNMSLGNQYNAHDGTSTVDEAVDSFTSSGNGRIAVVAAGNEGNEEIHLTGTVANSATKNITFTVPSYTGKTGSSNDIVVFELWWDNYSDVEAKVTSPNGLYYSRAKNEEGTRTTEDGAITIINKTDSDHSNGDLRTYIEVFDSDADSIPKNGTWTIGLTNTSGSTRTYHAWMPYSSFGSTPVHATLTGADSTYTIASPGTASSAITVAGHTSRWRWHATDNGNYAFQSPDKSDDIAYFSSIGPTRNGSQKPDLSASGRGVFAPTSTDYTPIAEYEIVADKYHLTQGTSISSPLVSGAVALMLDYNASLTASEAKSLLTSNATTDAYTGTGGSIPNYVWGYGKLNIFESMAKAIASAAVVNHDIYSYDTWNAYGSGNLPNGYYFSLKFSPTTSGDVSGAQFHTTSSTGTSGSISFEIWSDNGSGKPSAKLGSTVTYAVDDAGKYSWNYVSLKATGVNVSSGTDYHLICKNTATGNFGLLYENGTSSGRSYYSSSGSSWTAISNWHLRPIISTNEETLDSSLPVELAFFNASTVKGQMVLKWATESETENLGFMIERRKSGSDAWKFISDHTKDKGLEGQGSTSSRTDYIYYDKKAKPGVKYDYRLTDIPYTSAYTPNSIVLEDIEFRIAKFALHKNYPNPFNPATTISYELSDYSDVQVKIFDVNGREVQSWDHNGQEAGYYEMVWAGINHSGRPVSAGLYLLSVQAGNNLQTRKLLLLK